MNFLKKTTAVLMVGFGARSFTSASTSCNGMGIRNWSNFTNFGISMVKQIRAADTYNGSVNE